MIITGDPKAVASAYVAARSEIETLLVKDGRNNRSSYPTLANILATITPTLITHGLVLMQETTSNEFGVGVSTSILHSSGASIDFAPLTMQPTDLKPQTVGSTISYCRRYALISALGLVGGKEDDDGEKGQYGDKAKAAEYHDEAMWDTPEPAPAKRDTSQDLVSPAMLLRLTTLMEQFYGKTWQAKEVEMAQGASKNRSTGKVSAFEQLRTNEVEIMLAGLEKRIKNALGQKSQLQPVNGHKAA